VILDQLIGIVRDPPCVSPARAGALELGGGIDEGKSIMGWAVWNVSGHLGAPPSTNGISAYFDTGDSTRHAVYLEGNPTAVGSGTTGAVVELYSGTDTVWHWKYLNHPSGGERAASVPAGYWFAAEGTQHVVYRSDDGHLRELYFTDDWYGNDLSDNDIQTGDVIGFVHGWASRGRQYIAFRGGDGKVRLGQRTQDADDVVWETKMLGDATGSPFPAGDSTPRGVGRPSDDAQIIVYRAADGTLHQYSGHNGNWVYHGMILPSGAPTAAGDPFPYVDAGAGTFQVAYVAADRSVHVLTGDGGAPYAHETDASWPGAHSPVVGYTYDSNAQAPIATQHIVYVDTTNTLHELWREQGQWHHNALPTPLPPDTFWTPTAYADPAIGQIVHYQDTQRNVVVLHYTPSATDRTGGIHVGQGTIDVGQATVHASAGGLVNAVERPGEKDLHIRRARGPAGVD
jgi:hypothetical protein